MRSFYGCYLLRSLDPAARVKTYIGFTVNPRRRIRQHNGEITSGAWRTRRGRPWEMVLVVYGFPTQVHALQFEWAWQHPKKSKVAREVLAAIKTSHRTGLQGKVRLLMGMLNTPPWRYYPLTLQFLAQQHSELPRGCPGFPDNLDVLVSPLDTLPTSLHDNEEAEDESAAAAASEERSGSAADSSDGSDAESSSTGSGADSEGVGCTGSNDKSPAAAAAAAVRQRQQEEGLLTQPGDANGSSGGGGGGGRRRRRRLSGSSGVVLLTDSSDDVDGMQQSQQQDLPQPLHLRLQQQQQQKQQEAQEPELNASEVVSAAFSHRAVSQQSVPSTAAAAAAATAARKGKGRRAQRSAAAAAAAASDSAPARVTRCPCCSKYLDAFVLSCPACSTEYHTHCLAEAISSQQQQQQGLSSQPMGLQELGSSGSNVLRRRGLPAQGSCPSCGDRLVWLDVLAAMKRHGGGDGSNGAAAGSRRTKRGKAAGDTALVAAGGEHVGATRTTGKTGRQNGSRRGKAAAAAGSGTSGRGRVAAGSAAAPAPEAAAGAEAAAAAAAVRPRQRAAAATAAARSRRYVVAAAAAAPVDQPALRDLMQHLQQHYPHLQLPSDPLALQQLLLEQPGHSQVHDQLSGKPGGQEQQQQEWEGLAAGLASMQQGRAAAEGVIQAAAEADVMDLCSDEGDTSKQRQQQQQLGGQRCSLQAWLDEHLQQQEVEVEVPQQQRQGLQQQHDRVILTGQQPELQQEPCQPVEPFDLTSSPEPLLQRLKLASPGKGKRTRATAGGTNQPAAATVANLAAVSKASTALLAAQELDAGSSSDKGGSSNDGSDGSSPQRLAVRCRVNGTTPAAMVLKSRTRAPGGSKDAVHEAAGDAGYAAVAAATAVAAAAGNQGGSSWLFHGEDYTAAAASGLPIDSPAYGVAEQFDPACKPYRVPPAAAAAGAACTAARENTVQNVCRLARSSRQMQQDVICLLDSD